MKSHLLLMIFLLVSSFSVMAQVESVGLIGSGSPGGWDTDTEMVLFDEEEQIWYLKVYLTNAEVKFRANNAWDINWGDTGFPFGTGVQGGPNIPIAAEGEYEILFSALTGEYFFYYESPVGIIGDATIFGWDDDINLFPNPTDSNKFFITLDLSVGNAKFRLNDDWAINWGSPDFPSGVGVLSGENIPIPNAGKYNITFDTATGEYFFEELVSFTSIGVIGSATEGGWDLETPLRKDANDPNLWKGTVILVDGELKFRANDNWDVNWGGTDFPIGTATPGGDNLAVLAGEYIVKFNTETLEYSFTQILEYETVGIIGSATPNGWDEETPMIKDAEDKSVWRLRIVLNEGEAKFRANNSWDFNWGGSDFPAGIAEFENGPNILIPAGEYRITFNSTTGEYYFEEIIEFGKISLVGKNGPFGDWPGDDDSRDTYLEKDETDGNLWTHPSVTLTGFGDVTDGGIKFRAEAAWTINWGAREFPEGVGTQNGPNIEPVAGTYKVVFRSDTGEYAFGAPTYSTEVLNPANIKVFPNPATDFLTIQFATDEINGDIEVTISALDGSQVSKQIVNVNQSGTINIQGLNPGNYILSMKNNTYFGVKKISVVR